MGRVFFPTYSLNRFGVRVASQRATLGAIGERFPAEPTPRAAMTPTGPMLGAVAPIGDMVRYYPPWPGPMPVWPGSYPSPIYQVSVPASPTGPISSSGGGGSAPTPASPSGPAPSVATQVLPTPTVTMPPPAPSTPLLVSTGGGTQTPSTPTVIAAPSGGLVEGIAVWLSGRTMLLNYNVPNIIIAGVIVLGFAWLSADSRRRR